MFISLCLTTASAPGWLLAVILTYAVVKIVQETQRSLASEEAKLEQSMPASNVSREFATKSALLASSGLIAVVANPGVAAFAVTGSLLRYGFSLFQPLKEESAVAEQKRATPPHA